MKKNFFSKNIRFLREKRGLKLSDFAQYGIKIGTMSNYELGKTEPKLETVIFFSNFFRTSVDNLLFADYETCEKQQTGTITDDDIKMHESIKESIREEVVKLTPDLTPKADTQGTTKRHPNNTQQQKDEYNSSDPKWNAEFSSIDTPATLKEIAVEHIPTNMLKGRAEAYKPIPFVGEAAVAGFGSADFAIKERDVKDYYVIPKFKDSNIDFMIEIHGESMYPTFKSGDVVACTIIRESTFIQWNRVHLIATAEQGILIKRLKKGITGTTIMLVSDNPDYDPFEVELTSVRGIALVQGLVRLE